jgi:predicted kinase
MKTQKEIADLLNCLPSQLSSFSKEDPLNKNNIVSGYLCRKKGPYYGSMYITDINGTQQDQLIYGTPTLQYPYKAGTTDYKDWGTNLRVIFSTKWNGVNALLFKYTYADTIFFSVKTKGSPFIANGQFGNFLDLFREWAPGNLGHWAHLLNEAINLQSVTFELCGTKEPHLVKYDFDLQFKPLFYTKVNGAIVPYMETTYSVHLFKDTESLNRRIAASQSINFSYNEEYRQSNNLPLKYEYNHFITEGEVLYIVNEYNEVIDRTAYKIKPKDIEEVHWATFEKNYQAKVNEALRKLALTQTKVTAETLQSELDMGPKEWDKFGDKIMKYVDSYYPKDNEVLILVGLQGSGKSTLAKVYSEHGYVVVNQDTLGSRNACKRRVEDALKLGKSVVIDRCNFDERQRKTWIDLAKHYGVGKITAYMLDISVNTCIKRAELRENHPNINKENASRVITDTVTKLVTPTLSEGFDEIKIAIESQ